MTNPANFFKQGHKKTGGRKKGTPNKMTSLLKKRFQELMDSEVKMTPLQAMLGILKIRVDQGDFEGALLAAEKAAPYVHARLNATDVRVLHSVAGKSDSEIAVEIAALRAKLDAARSLPAPPVIDAVPESVEAASAEGVVTVPENADAAQQTKGLR
jgi:hypothetical protein